MTTRAKMSEDEHSDGNYHLAKLWAEVLESNFLQQTFHA